MKQKLAKRLPTAKVFTHEGVKFWVAPWCEPQRFDRAAGKWVPVLADSTEYGILERHGW
ncbi:MAG: hypothetical protein QNJ92_06720 [Alphaproteobacteria bacterium]|nr:hypothetical protein [Alphaproteobacteria bacterium]